MENIDPDLPEEINNIIKNLHENRNLFSNIQYPTLIKDCLHTLNNFALLDIETKHKLISCGLQLKILCQNKESNPELFLNIPLEEKKIISGFIDENADHQWKLISEHFEKNKRKPFKPGQLSSAYQRMTVKKEIDTLLSILSDL